MGDHKLNPFARGTLAAPPPADARDAYNRPLHPGDLVIINDADLLKHAMRVTAITPNLHPGASPNTLTVTLMSRVQVLVRAGEGTPSFIRVVTAAEAGLEAPPVTDPPADKQTSLVVE